MGGHRLTPATRDFFSPVVPYQFHGQGGRSVIATLRSATRGHEFFEGVRSYLAYLFFFFFFVVFCALLPPLFFFFGWGFPPNPHLPFGECGLRHKGPEHKAFIPPFS